jgi:hypothetical protein
LLQIHLLLETRLDDGKLVSMDAFTLMVNAHGGLLEISFKLPKRHRIWLLNAAGGAKVPCRVVGVRKSQDGVFAIAFEFENPSPDFWPLSFPPPDWQLIHSK